MPELTAPALPRTAGAAAAELSRGHPDMPPPPAIAAAVRQVLQAPPPGYSTGLDELKRAVADDLAARHGAETLDGRDVVLTHGASGALFCVLQTLLAPDDELVYLTPAWHLVEPAARALRCRAVPVPLLDDECKDVVAAVARRLTARTRVLFINSPHNPTGIVLGRAILARIAQLAREAGVWLVADETYDRFVYAPAEHVSPLVLAGSADHVVSIGSCSKTYSMPEWRMGWAVVPRRLTSRVEAAVFATTGTLSAVAQCAALAALETPAAELAQRTESFRRRRDAALDALAGTEGIRALPPEGTFFVLVDVRARGRSSDETAELLRERGLQVAPGTAFGPDGEGYVRLSLTLPADRLAAALQPLVEPW
jgi:aspartate/methionine/tyrosine aminotransferase